MHILLILEGRASCLFVTLHWDRFSHAHCQVKNVTQLNSTLTEAPEGFHSLQGVRKSLQPDSIFTENELVSFLLSQVVYDTTQQRQAYLVEFRSAGTAVTVEEKNKVNAPTSIPKSVSAPLEPKKPAAPEKKEQKKPSFEVYQAKKEELKGKKPAKAPVSKTWAKKDSDSEEEEKPKKKSPANRKTPTTPSELEATLHSNTIEVKSLTGKSFILPFNPLATVLQCKTLLFGQSGIPVPQQRLIFAGKQLEDHRPLSDYGIIAQSSLFLVLKLGDFPLPKTKPPTEKPSSQKAKPFDIPSKETKPSLPKKGLPKKGLPTSTKQGKQFFPFTPVKSAVSFTSSVGDPNASLEEQEILRENELRGLFANHPNDPVLQNPYLSLIDVYSAPSTFRVAPFSQAKIPRMFLSNDARTGSSIVDQAKFQANWASVGGNLLDGLNWKSVFVAGGSVLACLTSDDIATYSGLFLNSPSSRL
jgi:large subunit ribosomal protein L40e